MLYLLLPFYDEAAWFNQSKAEQEKGSAAYGEYSQVLVDAGVLVGNYRPHPTTAAKTVQVTGDKVDVQKGSLIDGKLQVGGVYIVDVPSLEAALDWAARNPAAAYGAVEVRGIWDSGQ
jgi:hypothetical protein